MVWEKNPFLIAFSPFVWGFTCSCKEEGKKEEKKRKKREATLEVSRNQG